jgi:hypothetical protein
LSKIRGDIASQGAPPVSTTVAENFATSFTGIVDTGGKFATGVNDTGGKFAARPVSTTPVANCHQYERHWWQTMGTISGCRYLKVNLKAKMYIC